MSEEPTYCRYHGEVETPPRRGPLCYYDETGPWWYGGWDPVVPSREGLVELMELYATGTYRRFDDCERAVVEGFRSTTVPTASGRMVTGGGFTPPRDAWCAPLGEEWPDLEERYDSGDDTEESDGVSESERLRLEAQRMLTRASRLEELEALTRLPVGSVVTFQRSTGSSWRGDLREYVYAAVVVDVREEGAATRRAWYLTGTIAGRRGDGRFTDAQLVEQLQRWSVDAADVRVAVAWAALGEAEGVAARLQDANSAPVGETRILRNDRPAPVELRTDDEVTQIISETVARWRAGERPGDAAGGPDPDVRD